MGAIQRITRHVSVLFCALSLAPMGHDACADEPRIGKTDLQIFGDFFVSEHAAQDELDRSKNIGSTLGFFRDVKDLLGSATWNVVNFEGVVGLKGTPLEPKEHLLRMPISAPELLRDAGIRFATLANNHSMDFGYPGLLGTLRALDQASIATAGAGADFRAASLPITINSKRLHLCLLAASRTYPSSHWATGNHPGTANFTYDRLGERIRELSKDCTSTLLLVHWGREGEKEPQEYQRLLAQHAIRSGVDGVFGHHPHVVQSIEFWRGKPIVYSLGNFVFTTKGPRSKSEGLVSRIKFSETGRPISLELSGLIVNHRAVGYYPRLPEASDTDFAKTALGENHPCRKVSRSTFWKCPISNDILSTKK